jgi:lipoyl(octanoyl) transferase
MIEIQKWGLIPYRSALTRQKAIAEEIMHKRNRNVLVLCQHPRVITVGRNGKKGNIICDRGFLDSLGFEIFEVDRGGDVTLHNPGQLVGYPIFNLSDFKEDLHWFLRKVEHIIIQLVLTFGIKAHTLEGLTGVWVEQSRKIAAIGFHCSRWVTTHGFALNVNNNIREFDYIVPCGIKNKGITSISQEIGTNIDFNSVVDKCIEIFVKEFQEEKLFF